MQQLVGSEIAELSADDVLQNIQSLKESKAKLFLDINENDVDGHMLDFKLRHLANSGETKNVQNHVSELRNVAILIKNITDSLENLELKLGSLSIKPGDLDNKGLLLKRENLIKTLHRALKSEVSIKRNFYKISKILSKYFEQSEVQHFESYIKKKIKLILQLIDVEKKIQYELNRYKILTNS